MAWKLQTTRWLNGRDDDTARRPRTTSPALGVCIAAGLVVFALSHGTGLILTADAQQQPAHSDTADLPDFAGEPVEQWEVLDRYCLGCHNFMDWAGGVAFDTLHREHLSEDAEVWEATVRKLRTGLMPPQGEPRPGRGVLDGIAQWLETELDQAWELQPDPGVEGLSRLNRSEYANVIRDLLAYDAAAAVADLPADASIGGFDNIAEALTVSPTLLEGYVSAAMQISRTAVGDRAMAPTEVRYPGPGGGAVQRVHLDGLPLGTRGGMAVEHYFPMDAEYEFRVAANIPVSGWQNPQGVLVWCDGPSVDLTFNGAALEDVDYRRFRLRVPAGPQRMTVALLDQGRCAGTGELYEGDVSVGGAIQALEIHGPFDITAAGDTPSRRAIFSCRPENSTEELACARQILRDLATRGYRRPVSSGAPEVETLLAFYEMGREEGGDFDVGIQYALSRLLVEPRFLYRFEEEPEEIAIGEIYRISDLELASRLSFFLWSSIPDAELLELAASGELSDPQVLAQQVDRMLEDARSSALVENFAGQWLKLRDLDAAIPQDPAFNAGLRKAFGQETVLFFSSVIREQRSVLELLDADYTFLNEQLAGHYGIDGVRGSYMRRVELPRESPRRGLLGQGSILTATSVPNRTSPVVRGEWIVENILGAPVPAPPPGVEADLSDDAEEEERLQGNTLRERLEMHLADPVCAGCHGIIDPIGLALENFDLIGRWREEDNGFAIDTAVQMVDGTRIAGPADLRQALLERSESFVTAMTERLLTYALGRELGYNDQPVVRRIVRGAAERGYTFVALAQHIVASDSFQMRVKTGPLDATGDLQARQDQ